MDPNPGNHLGTHCMPAVNRSTAVSEKCSLGSPIEIWPDSCIIS
ncbi:rCG49740 [Rattus norvegicus]|uniref:RCG49740 n=1 Tax=Rattus norvegicus TaxID=10116 RepID=A6K2J7_RAT|nr:rCG49740 [Rattus norvegicus]